MKPGSLVRVVCKVVEVGRKLDSPGVDDALGGRTEGGDVQPQAKARRTAAQEEGRAVPVRTRPVVHVVEDDPELASYLKSLLESVDLDVRVHGQATEFLASYRAHSPECLLVDLRLPGISGLELQRRLIHKNATLPVVFMTGYGTTATAVQAMKQGAFDFFEKPFSSVELLDVVQAALEKDRKESRKRESFAEIHSRFDRLTQREREILELVVEGLPSKVIASRLELSKKTVDLHRSRIMTKLSAGSIVNLIKLALLDKRILRKECERAQTATNDV
jgi:two-component system response regulator FixJ